MKANFKLISFLSHFIEYLIVTLKTLPILHSIWGLPIMPLSSLNRGSLLYSPGGQLVALTTEGKDCSLPFTHNGKVYNSCVLDSFNPWCVSGEREIVTRVPGGIEPSQHYQDYLLRRTRGEPYYDVASEFWPQWSPEEVMIEKEPQFSVCLSNWGKQINVFFKIVPKLRSNSNEANCILYNLRTYFTKIKFS